MASVATYDENKFRELVVYISAKSEDDVTFGSVKLNKLLFYSDFLSYMKTGSAVTGAIYQKLEHGPAPRRMKPVIRGLESDRSVVNREISFGRYTQVRVVPLRDPDLSNFTANEIAIVDQVIDLLRGQNGSQVSEMSHRFAGWKYAALGEDIPYFTTCIPNEPAALDEDEVSWANAVADRLEATP